MTRLFATGFDLYDAATISQFFTGNSGVSTISSGSSRWSGGRGLGMITGGSVSKTWGTNEATLVVGFAWFPGGLNTDIVQFIDGVTTQCSLNITSVGAVQFMRGATQLAISGPGIVVTNIWHYWEVKVTINNSTGAFEVRLDGNSTPVISGSGVNTRTTSNNYANSVIWNGTSAFSNYDDIYLINTAGSVNNDFLGDTRIEGLVPTGAGAHTDWTPLSGANWQEVKDIPPDDNTSYNYSNTVNNIDTYAMSDLTSLSGTVRWVQHTLRARKDDAGTRKIAPVFRIGGTDYVGSDQTLSTSFQTVQQAYETSPATSSAWTISEINALEMGQKVTA